MTERLGALLHEEADTLTIPAPPARQVLARGRGLRRRRRLATGIAGLSILAVLGAGTGIAIDSTGDDPAGPQVTGAMASYLHGGAYAIGSTIHFGDSGDSSVTLDEEVKALYYTSAGVVVRSGETPWTDDPGPSHYSLVAPDGTVSDLGLDLGDRTPSTDPTQPLLAYGDSNGDGWAVVVRDVVTGEVLARVPVPGSFTWGGWEAPPVALSGDLVFVGMDQATVEVDWRTGETRTADEPGAARMPEVWGGRAVRAAGDALVVYDVATGEDLLPLDGSRELEVQLSPNGRYAKVVEEEGFEGGTIAVPEQFEIHDVDAGTHVTVDRKPWGFGWTPDGHLLSVSEGSVTLCDPGTGDCTEAEVAAGKGEVKIAGNSYES